MKILYKVFLLLAFQFILISCIDLCENTLDYKVVSPNNANIVFVFERSCGATTGFVTHISVRKNDKLLNNDHGNLFIATGSQSKFSAIGTIPTKVVWLDNKNLLIRYDKNATIYKKVEEREGIKIKYEVF